MHNRKIYAIGETVLDIIFENNLPKTAKPGGSALNASISLGRLNLPVSFISEWGNDEVGTLIDNFLKNNNVSTSYVYRYSIGQSALAMAFLDENKNAHYSFYKNFPEKRLNIEFPVIKQNDIVLFSSFYAINKEIRPKLVEFISKAKKAKAIIIYDPNFRKAHLHELDELKPFILENISMADIVRGSDEDFENIFNVTNSKKAYLKIKENRCNNLIYTASNKGVYVHSSQIEAQYEVDNIIPVSTIGAGDNFNAGIIYAIFKNKIIKENINQLSKSQLDEIIKHGIKFSQEVCMSWENYVSKEFAENHF